MFGNTGKSLWWQILIIILAVWLAILLYFAFNQGKENVVLKQAIKQMETQLQEKEKQIQSLQDQIEELKKEQVLKEKRIVALKQKRENIKPPKDIEEITKRFKELGYEVVIK